MPATTPFSSAPYATTAAGEEIHRIRLCGDLLEVDVLTWGATLQGIRMRGADGPADVVLGYPTLTAYESDRHYLGAVVGRYANRIADGVFELDGQRHELPRNDRGHTLHGGPEGFHRQVWSARAAGTPEVPGVLLEHESPDGAMGFPGTLRASCRYLLDGSDLAVELRATCDRPTVVNLTQHAYFNLAGPGRRTVEDHVLWIDADRYLPVDETAIPLPGSAPVAGTPFDFREPKPVGADLRRADTQLAVARGYDHCLLLNGAGLDRPSARLHDPASGRTLEVFTDQPGLQVYSGNGLDGSEEGNQGLYRQSDGICLETQRLPDGPNRPGAAAVLRPGEEYVARTRWRFTT